MTDSDSSDPISKAFHCNMEAWKDYEKWYDESYYMWISMIDDNEEHVKVRRQDLQNLLLYVKSLRHIVSCENCDQKAVELPLRITKKRNTQE
jgi:hypothetical protein